ECFSADGLRLDQVKVYVIFFFSSRRRHTSSKRDWSSDVCSSDLDLEFNLLRRWASNVFVGFIVSKLNSKSTAFACSVILAVICFACSTLPNFFAILS